MKVKVITKWGSSKQKRWTPSHQNCRCSWSAASDNQLPKAAEAENMVRVKIKNEGEGHCKPKTSTEAGTKSMEGQRGGLLKVSQVSVRHLSIAPSIWIPDPLLEIQDMLLNTRMYAMKRSNFQKKIFCNDMLNVFYAVTRKLWSNRAQCRNLISKKPFCNDMLKDFYAVRRKLLTNS